MATNNHTYIMLHDIICMTWAEHMKNPTQNLDVTLCYIMYQRFFVRNFVFTRVYIMLHYVRDVKSGIYSNITTGFEPHPGTSFFKGSYIL